MRWLLPCLGLVLLASGCSSDEGIATREVSRIDYGTEWPLTVGEAVLACEGGDVTTVTVDGNSYRLDGLSADGEAAEGFRRIWAKDPVRGSRSDLSRLVEDAEALCD